MPRRFYSRRIPFFQNVAMLILCIVFFLLPFALRGARFAVRDIKNNVTDWLPDDFAETIDLGGFRKFFVGDQFVVISGPWCREGDGNYANLKRKLFEESLEYEQQLREQDQIEVIRAHRVGDEYGLLATGDYHETWGLHRERWLQGRDDKWFYINRKGELYEWQGQSNVIEGINRYLERMAHGRNVAKGRYIDRFGPQPDEANGFENPFYQNPELICARPFKSVTTGPEIVEKMAGPGGTLRIGNYSETDAAAFEARIEANKRLTGALFGPTPSPKFSWSYDSLLDNVQDAYLLEQLKSGEIFRRKFDAFVKYSAESEFGGDVTALDRAPQAKQLELWFRLWEALELPAPSRQTCLVVTISDAFLGELDRIVGRPMMGRPRGRILELATGECGLAMANVHMGGPPSDNVAIDEEGTSTLLRLASLSCLIGIILSYYSFRSVRVTIMLFFVGGVSAISSLAYVWFGGNTLDAILMTMPSLIYVLAISASVHLVNYYRDACHEFGPARAVEIAVSRGWFPCALAAFTTAIGLASLCTSNLTPIFKFGLYSAIATIATLFFLYSYLPAALYTWPPGYHKQRPGTVIEQSSFFRLADRFWEWMCGAVVRNSMAIVVIAVLLIGVFGYGVTRVRTTVQLLKLFDKDAKVLQDYRWMEENLGTLVPMEIVINVDQKFQAEVVQERDAAARESLASDSAEQDPDLPPPVVTEIQRSRQQVLAYTLLERMEIGYRVRQQLEHYFGPEGRDIVGAGMSPDVFVPLQTIDTQVSTGSAADYRRIFNDGLLSKKSMMRQEDYYAIDSGTPPNSPTENGSLPDDAAAEPPTGLEMWRISLRLAALNDVDYGRFVNDLKLVVEPILRAYQDRTAIMETVIDDQFVQSNERNGQILLLGREPTADEIRPVPAGAPDDSLADVIDQGFLYRDTLQDLLENRGFVRSAKPKPGTFRWLDPARFGDDVAFPAPEVWADALKKFDCVVMVEDHPLFDESVIREHAKTVVDCRQHFFDPSGAGGPFQFSETAMNREKAGEDIAVSATYTGIVPIVYKAQRALLHSLIESILLSFAMISVVMMLLLRNWRERMRVQNLLSFRAGLLSMIPNVFPIVLVFGAMGFLGISVDIGSMMTASVAMGIAVDDTIHFLTWYRQGLGEGMNRMDALRKAYSHCASAMTQTTMIAGFGLSVFALSTFAPTQRFGVLMLVLLATALVGDLVILPALLASPFGKLFGQPSTPKNSVTGELAAGDIPVTIPLQRPSSGESSRNPGTEGRSRGSGL